METKEMCIEGRGLRETDIGSKVTYVPNHAKGEVTHPDCEGGTISSWNGWFVFVNYGRGTCAATKTENLVWG